MLETIYITFTILAFLFLALAIYSGSFGKQESENSLMNSQQRHTSRIGATVVLLLMSATLFVILALSSMSIETTHCENQINQTEIVGNTTTYTNHIGCINQRHSQDDLGEIYSGIIIAIIVLMFIYIVKDRF